MWSDWQEFSEALEGRFGEEEQQDALAFAEQSGLLDQWDAEDGEDGDVQYLDAVAAEMARVEERIGRPLTQGEVNALVDTISTQEAADGVVPDFHAEFGHELANAANSTDGRVHLGAETAQRVFEEQGRTDIGDTAPPLQFEVPTGEGDY